MAYQHKDTPGSFWEKAQMRIGFVACWAEKDDKHCRKPKGHDGEHAYY